MTTLAELAGICRVTEQAVSQWVKAGMPVAAQASMGGKGGSKPATLDLEACMRWYFGTNFERFELERARSRLANEQADSAAHKNAETRGDLVRLSNVTKVVGTAMSIFRTISLALPSKLAPELEGLKASEIEAALDRDIRQNLETIAAFDFRTGDHQESPDETVAPAGEASARAKRKPVGRRVPVRKPRGKRKAR